MHRFLTCLLLFTLFAGAGQTWQGAPSTRPAPPRGQQPITPYSIYAGELSEEERRLMDEALQHFREQDWPKAAKAYEAVTRKNPKIGIAWFRLGYVLHMQGKFDDALAATEKAVAFPELRATAYFNLGCSNALKGKREQAMGYLEKAIEAGFSRLDLLESDGDLATLRDEPRYARLVGRLKTAVSADLYNQLNFWIGEWDVADARGRKLGVSSIKKAENGFLITERWTSAGDYTGTNFFYFDPSDRKWRLHWVSNTGEIVRASGVTKNGVLTLDGEHINSADGKVSDFRGTIAVQPGGKVKQTLELGKDNKWRTYFEGVYSPSAVKVP